MAELEERKGPAVAGQAADDASLGTPAGHASGAGGGFRAKLMRMLLGLMVLGLGASTLYLLAERNSRFYYLSQEGGSLVVSRGEWLPSGKRPYLPEDSRSAEIYAPIRLPADVAPIAEQRFSERQELDRALFELLADLASSRIHSERMETMQEGFALVERASLLPGISAEQSTRLRALRAELSFFEGRAHLQEAVVLLRQAREKLELATEASSARGEEAAVLLRRLAPATEILSRTLQRSKGWDVSPAEERAPQEEEPAEELPQEKPPVAAAPVAEPPPARAAPKATQPAAEAPARPAETRSAAPKKEHPQDEVAVPGDVDP